MLVPGRALGGIELGATRAEVRARWGSDFGRCLCLAEIWYFNYRKFRQPGAGVEFRNGRVAAVFTVWAPRGWRTTNGLAIGDPSVQIGIRYGRVLRTECGSYVAFSKTGGSVTTTYYAINNKVWGFGLSRPDVPVCR